MRHLSLEAFPHVEYGILNMISLDWNEPIVGTVNYGVKCTASSDRITFGVQRVAKSEIGGAV